MAESNMSAADVKRHIVEINASGNFPDEPTLQELTA